MELKEFVAETLVQIVDSIVATHSNIKDKGACVNPARLSSSSDDYILGTEDRLRLVSTIDFEVSLTETEGKEAGARIGVFFGSAGAAGKAKYETGSNAVNKVKFSIPILLPSFEGGAHRAEPNKPFDYTG
jgi:hypothetical protein